MKAHVSKRLILEHEKLLSYFAFNFNLCRYTPVEAAVADAELEAAAIRIQAVQRGKVARAEVAALKAEQAAPAEGEAEPVTAADAAAVADGGVVSVAEAAAEAGEEAGAAELNAAAVKIQAAHRGKAARVQVATMKAETVAAESDVPPLDVITAKTEAGRMLNPAEKSALGSAANDEAAAAEDEDNVAAAVLHETVKALVLEVGEEWAEEDEVEVDVPRLSKGREQSEREIVLSSRQSEGEVAQQQQAKEEEEEEADAPRLPPGKA